MGAYMGVSPRSGAKPIPMQEEKPKVDYNKPSNEVVMVPFGVELLEEKLPFDIVNNEKSGATDPRLARGIRVFATPVEPGQNLKLSLKATPIIEFLVNWVLLPDRKHPLYSKVKIAIDNQVTRRTSTISIKNTTKEQCVIMFSVAGVAEQPYSVKIERK
jgi:hypothetical protein